MKNKITWLHLSDIHFHPKKEWRDSESRDSLLECISNIFKSTPDLYPDFIFCTGDIAFGEETAAPLTEQYDCAKSFFDALLKACSKAGPPLPRDRLFVVPGNHDVNRKSINQDAQRSLNSWAKQPNDYLAEINQRFNDKSIEFLDSIKRLDAYSNFVRDYLPHQQDKEGRSLFAVNYDLNGATIGIAGFNSAWTCAGNEDDRNIWLASGWQFNNAHKKIKDSDIRIGLIHHPLDWLNEADRSIANERVSTDYHFWLHGHSHKAWVTSSQSNVTIAAGAVGAQSSEEFGVNITQINLLTSKGTTHLYKKRAGARGWTIDPIATHAPYGKWSFNLPLGLNHKENIDENSPIAPLNSGKYADDWIHRHFSKNLESSLRSFSTQPKIWAPPIISKFDESNKENTDGTKIDIAELIAAKDSHLIKAPPQYGLTCLSHYLIKEAWVKSNKFWLYIDAKQIKSNLHSVNTAINESLNFFEFSESHITCVILDSWSAQENDGLKLLRVVSDRFKTLPIICMQQVDSTLINQIGNQVLPREFNNLYLWSLPRTHIRSIVSAYNNERQMGDEDAITKRLVSDLDVLNLHRTAFNCITLLKVSELDFDESPVNRSEIIRRVLFLLFNVENIPTYKTRPDLKDCEYVLGYFCERLIRRQTYHFSRDEFLLGLQECCEERLIELETHLVFDILYANNIIIKKGSFFYFRFSYWILYFSAQRMHHDEEFSNYIFEDSRYASFPEIIEFYTGIDRRRDDALIRLAKDLDFATQQVSNGCGLPDSFNPYGLARWESSSDAQSKMQEEIASGVRESNLPCEIKDQYLDEGYDRSKPYNQDITEIVSGQTFVRMMQTMSAASRALRNSDYAAPATKKALLREILKCWNQASKVLLVVMPMLVEHGRAVYDGANFKLRGDFGCTPRERAIAILQEIPRNIVTWSENDLFSQKMGPLLLDHINTPNLNELERHLLALLMIRQRPRGWNKEISRYISNTQKNSFFLFDVFRSLRGEYRVSYATRSTLDDIESLIKIAMTRHVTGQKSPSAKQLKRMSFSDDLIPPRTTEN